ncbi:MAG: hypothetical protein ACI9JN_002163 [Bacteroidia bacterium]|jgi:hypothetical protein
MNKVIRISIATAVVLMLYKISLYCLVFHNFELDRCLVKGFDLIKPEWLYWTELILALMLFICLLVTDKKTPITILYPSLSLVYVFSLAMYSYPILRSPLWELYIYIIYFVVFGVWIFQRISISNVPDDLKDESSI